MAPGYAHPIIAILIVISLGSCASTDELNENDAGRTHERPSPDYTHVEMDLAPVPSDVASVQLFETGDETNLPIASIRGGQTLTLKFDMLNTSARPLSIFFYHADRNWQRDLQPHQYLAGFQREDLHDYAQSRLTEVPYIHYQYRFPNQNVRFLISGNYILRVTEQGREDEVLFERPFFVTEEAVELHLDVLPIMIAAGSWPTSQPIVRFRPPQELSQEFFDFNVCFTRNARFDLTRCSARPSMIELPVLQYYLPPESSFEVNDEYRVLDLRVLRTGHRVISVDLESTPYRVEIDTDYGRFSGNPSGIFLNGQPVIASQVREVADPDISAQYVNVLFRYVPSSNEPLPGPVLVTGSFNQWRYDPENRMTWNEELNRYEAEVLMKQGLYEYLYHTVEYGADTSGRQQLTNLRNLYSALLYYFDISLNTDRLLAMQNVEAR